MIIRYLDPQGRIQKASVYMRVLLAEQEKVLRTSNCTAVPFFLPFYLTNPRPPPPPPPPRHWSIGSIGSIGSK